MKNWERNNLKKNAFPGKGQQHWEYLYGPITSQIARSDVNNQANDYSQ